LQSLKWLGVEDQINDGWAIGGIPEYFLHLVGISSTEVSKMSQEHLQSQLPNDVPVLSEIMMYIIIYIYNPVPGPERVATELPMRRVIEVRRHVPWIATWNLLLFYVIKS
jgi:hypothetical protein